ncbi:hypothetical protein CANARDRAFT_26842 [[Candida] arabinofermentans NRRL YB-2248]|uniref:Uncharacterized protein n=1 Tax=[Candida] arabinofermentans NRRL YB-2248 TaxID=983967 RepID=A0A1E4T6T3_9ASCO|nr:hypothetical protein CANARDRAFT_26842 [[Candida] arabinofermentans NRRL YB-2248]
MDSVSEAHEDHDASRTYHSKHLLGALEIEIPDLSNSPIPDGSTNGTFMPIDLDVLNSEETYNARVQGSPASLRKTRESDYFMNAQVSNNNNNNDDDGYGRQPLAFKLGNPPSQENDPKTPINQSHPDFPAMIVDQRRASLAIKQRTSSPNYTLNIMVRQFTKYAERKLNLCLNSAPLDREPNIIDLLSEGVDPTFDKIISSLGYIARRKPKSVTDAVMHWRRGKSELREMARTMLEKDVMLWKNFKYKNKTISHKKTTSRSSKTVSQETTTVDEEYDTVLKQLEKSVQKSEITFTQADRQFTISTYILWRVLTEVVRQTPNSTLIEETGLEEIMYNYLKNIDPFQVNQSIIHSSNWNLLAELLGHMSEKSLLSVSDRFIADLEKCPSGFTDGTGMSEPSLNLLIHGMRYLQFSNASLEKFEEVADFMKSLAKFFSKCENDNILISYCEVINQLLLSVAGTLTAEVNHPTWFDAIKMIYNKGLSIALNMPPKFWKSATTLVSTSLSVSPKSLFEQQWLKIVDLNIKRVKPKIQAYEKIVITTCLARLIWSYLYRYSDTLNAKTRNLESIANLLFQNQQNKKQQWITHDPLLIQATVQILRSMAYSQLNFTLENIVLPIMKSSFNGVSLENLSHEKMTLCIRTYSSILSDYSTKERPPFPTDDVIHSSLDPMEFSNDDNNEIFDSNSSNAAVHEEVSNIFTALLFLLDQQVGCKILDMNTSNSSQASTPSSASSTPTLQLKLSNLYFHTGDNTAKNVELFSTVISSATWCLNNNSAQYRKTIQLLVKNSIHDDESVASYSIETLKILMAKKNPNVIITTFARTAFYLDEKTTSFLNHEYLSSTEYIKLLEVYVDLLHCWLESLSETTKESVETPNEMYNVNHGFVQEEIQEFKTIEELELKNIVSIIDEVEGNGLFFLFSHDFRVRFLGSQILRVVAQFDEVIYDLTTSDDTSSKAAEEEFKKAHNRMPSKFVAEFGTRIIHVLESLDCFEFIQPKKAILSEAESKRFARLQLKQRKDTIIRLAESNHGVDAALWFKIFEEVLDSLVKRCPIQIAITRSHSCIRLVQLYDQIVQISSDGVSGKVNSLIWDYMLCLKIACSSLTSTSEQRLHIPDLPAPTQTSTNSLYSPLTRTHNRKRSQQLFTVQHQKITSAKSIFKMTVPLLTSSNNKLKDALVEGLSCLNVNIFMSFLQSIDNIMESWKKDIDSNKTPTYGDTRLRIEITGILTKLVAKFSKSGIEFVDDVVLTKLQIVLTNIKLMLSKQKSQTDYELQRLRKYFCGLLETFHQETSKIGQVDLWLPLTFRKQSFEYMEQWSGYGQDVALFGERYQIMMKEAASKSDAVSLQATLELQKRQLQYSAISCMTSLCSSPIANEDDSFNIPRLLSWIDSLFGTYNDKIHSLARKALLEILTANPDSDEIVDEVIKKCYTHDPSLGDYFITLSEAIVKGADSKYPVYRLLALTLFSSGSDNINVRAAASNLIEYTEMKFYGTNKSASFADGICCRSRVIYKRTLFELSTHFATAYPEERFKMISELTKLFHVVGSSPRRDILAVLLPWVQTVELNIAPDHPNRSNSLMVLFNFFEITVKLSHKIQNEVEALWVALGSGANGANLKEIYTFIVDHSLESKNLAFIECSRQVIVSLSTIKTGANLVELLLCNLEPKSMIPTDKRISEGEKEKKAEELDTEELPYVADLYISLQKTETISTSTFSLCELSVIFLVDLLLTPSESTKSKLPLLLQLSFVLMDHPLAIIQEQSVAMLIHLIHQYGDPAEENYKKIVDSLRSSDYQKHLWVHNDVLTDKNSGKIPENMDVLIRNVLSVFEKPIPGIQQEWSRTALAWATSCKVMHIASRSFQVFRRLISFLDLGMLRDMLSCLANTVSDENIGIQSFSMQILMTLNAITAELYSEQLIDFPQLFWAVIACLNTIHEAEFIEVVSTLSKFISKIDLDSADTVKCLIATFPPKWEGRFDGLQSVIMIGLRSCNAYGPSLKLLDRLNMLKDSEIIGSGDSRILMSLLANMPRFLHAQSTKRFGEDVTNAADVLCKMADNANMTALSRIITSLVKKRFRNKDDFLSQVVSVVKRQFFPEYSAQTLVFLLGLLFNKTSWIKIETMDLLKHIFRVIDLRSEEFVGLGADLVSPLLRLMMTDYVDLALEVLDEATSISASPLDKHYLMMSSGDSTMRKEYEKIATLFGIPDDSGWSIPMPAVSTARTRNNIHSVFSTCIVASTDEAGEENTAPPPPEFNRDDYVQYNPLSAEQQQLFNKQYQQQQQQQYINRQLMQYNTSSDEQDSLSNMLATLENLDSFFTKDTMDLPESYGHQYNGSVDTRSTVATSATESQNWGLNFDSPNLEQMQFSPTASFQTLMGESTPNAGIVPSSSFRHSTKLGKRRSSIGNIVESIQLSSKSVTDHSHGELPPLGSPMLAGGSATDDSDGIFRFDILRPSSKVKKRPSRLNSPVVTALNDDNNSPGSRTPRTPRTPRSARTPRSPYGKNSRFGRKYPPSNYKRTTRLYSPTGETHEEVNTDNE